MRQLSGIDAAFLQMETATTYAHVASVSTYAGVEGRDALTLPELRELVGRRIHRVPLLRQRLLELPLGLDRPYWVDDPEFDLDRHVREADLAGPVDDDKLAAWVSRTVARRLDRAHPLWELHLVRGFPDGRFALLGIVHHAAVDGIAGRDVLAAILDREPVPEPDPPAPEWRPAPLPSTSSRVLRGLAGLASQPLRVLELQQQAAAQLTNRIQEAGRALTSSTKPYDPVELWTGATAGSGARGGVGVSAAGLPAPRAPFNRHVSGRRAWTGVSLPRDQARQVRRVHGVGANDVVLALCAGALRSWLADNGGVPARPLRAMVPVSVRARSAGSGPPGSGNQVSFLVTDLPTHLAEPAARLRSIADTARQAKQEHDVLGVAAGLAGVADLVVPGVASAAVRAAFELRVTDWVDPVYNLVVSSVPGPQVALYLRGARLLHAYPVSVVTDGLGLNVTVQTGRNDLDFGLTACPDLVPGLGDLARALPAELAALAEAAPTPTN